MTNRYYIDRSRTETKQTCPRRGYWNYYYHNRGVVAAREIPPAWPLLTGTYIHNGIQQIIEGLRRGGLRGSDVTGASPADVAVGAGSIYVHNISPLFNDLEEGPAKDILLHNLKEQSELTTALIYGWYKIVYPQFIASYEPVDIEREEEITFQVGENEITLLTRTDCLSKVRGSDNYVIHNWKSVTSADKDWLEQWRYDQQTLTEYIAAENRIGKQIIGTIITGLVKGRKSEWPEDSGNWSHNNPMIYCWMKDNGGSIDYQAKYKWKCNGPHPLGRGSKECPGGQNHTRSGYYKGSVADKFPGGIIAWIDHLLASEPEILSPYFITLPPITRSDWEIERWKRQTLAREIEDVDRAREIERLITIEPDTAAILLDHYFPMRSGHGNCIRGGRCPYLDGCWGSADFDDNSKFKPREANHPREAEQWSTVNA